MTGLLVMRSQRGKSPIRTTPIQVWLGIIGPRTTIRHELGPIAWSMIVRPVMFSPESQWHVDGVALVANP
jgi:hypothetical protein